MARYANKDFGLGKPNKKEKQTAQKMANMAKGKPGPTPKTKLSAAMYTWADTNMSKLKNPTKKQQEIFRKYKSMKAAGDTPSNPKPKPTTKSTTKTKTTTTRKTPKPAQVSKAKASTNPGTSGSFRKSNPPSPTVERKPSRAASRARVNRTDPRQRSVKRNLREAAAAKRRRERKEQFSRPYGGVASRPPANPKEGDMYRKPFGPLMIYKNGKFVRA